MGTAPNFAPTWEKWKINLRKWDEKNIGVDTTGVVNKSLNRKERPGLLYGKLGTDPKCARYLGLLKIDRQISGKGIKEKY